MSDIDYDQIEGVWNADWDHDPLLHLTYEGVLRGLTQVVEDAGPDFVYRGDLSSEGTGCEYFRKGVPDCGVGRLLALNGITESVLDAAIAEAQIDEQIGELIDVGIITTDHPRTAELLCAFQRKQDAAVPWGLALSEAIESAKEYGRL